MKLTLWALPMKVKISSLGYFLETKDIFDRGMPVSKKRG